LNSASERSFLQLNKFLGRGEKPLPPKFITLKFAPLSNLRPKNYKIELINLRNRLFVFNIFSRIKIKELFYKAELNTRRFL